MLKLKKFFLMMVLVVGPWMLIWGCPEPGYSHEEQSSKASHDEHRNIPLEAQNAPNPIPRDQLSIERGKKLFLSFCAGCHGDQGRGDGPMAAELKLQPANLVQAAGHHTDGEFAWIIRTGKSPMPAFNKVLSDDKIWDVVNFIQSLNPQPQ